MPTKPTTHSRYGPYEYGQTPPLPRRSIWRREVTPLLVDLFLLACISTLLLDAEHWLFHRVRPHSLLWFPPATGGLIFSSVGTIIMLIVYLAFKRLGMSKLPAQIVAMAMLTILLYMFLSRPG